ncbi:MAG: chromate resistance protein ChrB domain-containing protein [Acidimicrobiales bacterium]
MRWVTRDCHVDRAACAWLIRRHVDAGAELDVVEDLSALPADATEAPGLDVLVRGLSMVVDDPRLPELATSLFDDLYEYRRRALQVVDGVDKQARPLQAISSRQLLQDLFAEHLDSSSGQCNDSRGAVRHPPSSRTGRQRSPS